jgi:hypothetical protein
VWLVLLSLADILLVWCLPVLVGQDLPQHLSYARILADYADPGLPFRETFLLPNHPQPYFTAYLLLAPIARVTSILTACRVVYTAYVVGMVMSFASLVGAVHPAAQGERRTPWTVLFGPLLVWNPVQCVGFLPFMLALPAVLLGVSAVMRATAGRARRPVLTLAFVSALAASLHLVAGGSLVAFACLYAVFRRSRRAFQVAGLTFAATLATLGIWRVVGERGLAELPDGMLAAAVARDGLWNGVASGLGMRWSTPASRWDFVVATVLGPLANGAKLAIGLAIVCLAAVVWTMRGERPGRDETAPSGLPYVLAVAFFTAMVVVTPTSMVLPEDICLLDFRLYVIAFMLAVAAIAPRALTPARAQLAVAAFSAFVLAVWARQLAGASREASSVVRLVGQLAPKDTLLALPFHDRSEFLDEDNSVTHYFPVYNTALRGGVTSLFWGKFSQHLPVGYRAGHEPARPPDWDPARVTRGQLLASSHVMVEWPDAGDADFRRYGADRVRQELDSGFAPMGCDGRWCLYKSPPRGEAEVSEPEEALR